MKTIRPVHLLPVRCECGENPIWVPEEHALYFVDTEKRTVFRYLPREEGPGDGLLERCTLQCDTQSIARHTDSKWVVLSPTGLWFWDRASGRTDFIGNPASGSPDILFCDCAVDPAGRLLAGTYNAKNFSAADGSIYRLDHDLSFDTVAAGLVFVNGIAFGPGGSVMYAAEMFARRIVVFDYDLRSGRASNRRVFAEFDERMGYPDGLIVDCEGFVWAGHWAGFRVTRFDPKGRADMAIEMPVPTATCMGFGGEDLEQLYITTARKGLSAEERAVHPTAGDLYAARPGVKGMPEHRFGAGG